MSRTFKHFPEDSKCPICNTGEDKECVLVPIDGTEDEDGRICEAIPIHLYCLIDVENVRYNRQSSILYKIVGTIH